MSSQIASIVLKVSHPRDPADVLCGISDKTTREKRSRRTHTKLNNIKTLLSSNPLSSFF